MLGYPKGSLLLEEPDQNEPLPSDDISWEQAVRALEISIVNMKPTDKQSIHQRMLT